MILLTDTSARQVLINPDKINNVFHNMKHGCTIIALDNGTSTSVQASVKEVHEMILDWEAGQ